MIAANANAEMIEAGREREAGREGGPIESRYHRRARTLVCLSSKFSSPPSAQIRAGKKVIATRSQVYAILHHFWRREVVAPVRARAHV